MARKSKKEGNFLFEDVLKYFTSQRGKSLNYKRGAAHTF
jgi:hypothetical protein